jgi:hypothetical protein
VNAAFSSAPVANSGFTAVYENGAVQVNAKAKFFKEGQGEYYLGLYLIENNVIGYQASIGNNANHKAVLRASFTQSSWGELLANGNIPTGSEFQKTFSLPLTNAPNSNYEVVSIIWKKTGNLYDVVNVWASKIGTTTSTEELEGISSFQLISSATLDAVAVRITLEQNQEQLKLENFDPQGRKVSTVFEGNLPQGVHTFEVDQEQPGTYFAVLTLQGKKMTRKFILY